MSRYLLDLSWQKDAMKAQLQIIFRAVSRHRLAQRYHLQRAAETRSNRAHYVVKAISRSSGPVPVARRLTFGALGHFGCVSERSCNSCNNAEAAVMLESTQVPLTHLAMSQPCSDYPDGGSIV